MAQRSTTKLINVDVYENMMLFDYLKYFCRWVKFGILVDVHISGG